MEATFALRPFGEKLLAASQGRKAAAALKSSYSADTEPDLVSGILIFDLAGVTQARPLPLHHIFKAARIQLQPHYPTAVLHFVNVRSGVRWALEKALEERHDFVLRRVEGANYEFELTCPPTVELAGGEMMTVGSRRRQMISVIARDGAGCVWCGRRLAYDDPEATLDHVRPHSRDGSKKIGNMLLSCAGCNYERGDRAAGKWLQLCLGRGREVNVGAVESAIKRSRRNRGLRRSFLSARQARRLPQQS